jgi:predicted RNA-binding Zn ribbon-like protein
MEETEKHAGMLALLGGRTSLEYANTVDWHASDEPIEYLTSYEALVGWSRHVGILDERQAEGLLAEAGRRPAEAEAVHGRAVALREAIYRIFAAIAAGLAAEGDDLALLNAELARALGPSRIVPSEDGYGWTGWDSVPTTDAAGSFWTRAVTGAGGGARWRIVAIGPRLAGTIGAAAPPDRATGAPIR